jgi:hypothetical protein
MFVVVNVLNIYKINPGISFRAATRIYYEKGLVLDLIACSPLTMLLVFSPEPLWIVVPFRLVRLVSVYHIIFLCEKLEIYYLEMTRYVTAAKTILFLIYLWHWSS